MTAANAVDALKLLQQHDVERLILDLKLQQTSSLGLIAEIKNLRPAIEIVVLTGYSSIATAVEAIKLGAFDYIAKPFSTDPLRIKVERALEFIRIPAKNERLYS